MVVVVILDQIKKSLSFVLADELKLLQQKNGDLFLKLTINVL